MNNWKISVDLASIWIVQVVMLIVTLIWPESCKWWMALMPTWCVLGIIALFWSISAISKLVYKIKRRKK